MVDTITLTRTVAGDPPAALGLITAVLSNEAGTYGIVNNANGVAVVPDNTAVTEIAPGIFEYSVSALDEGNYTAVWEVYDGIQRDYVPHVFNVDEEITTPVGVMLMDIEREVAQRLGPYEEVEVGSTSDTTVVVVPELKSSIEVEDYDDYYILRRGFFANGTVVPGFNQSDRIRSVVTYDPITGGVVPNRAWAVAPVSGEMIEFHYLHPTRLRRAVQMGLKRCYFMDRISMTFTSATGERELTNAPWVVQPEQISRVEFSYTGDVQVPRAIGWFRAFTQSAEVWIQSFRDPYPNTMLVTAKRPHFSYVNGVTSQNGPNEDTDILRVDINYAAAAGHIEAWRRNARFLMGPAQMGLAVSQEDAADEFTLQTNEKIRQPVDVLQLSNAYGRLPVETN